MAGERDWAAVRADYIAGMAPRELSAKYCIPVATISSVASRADPPWVAERKVHNDRANAASVAAAGEGAPSPTAGFGLADALKVLESIARDTDAKPRERIKALEVLGKRKAWWEPERGGEGGLADALRRIEQRRLDRERGGGA